jgi:hypothetical protein
MDFEGKYNVKSPGKEVDIYTTYCNKVLLKLFLLEIYSACAIVRDYCMMLGCETKTLLPEGLVRAFQYYVG